MTKITLSNQVMRKLNAEHVVGDIEYITNHVVANTPDETSELEVGQMTTTTGIHKIIHSLRNYRLADLASQVANQVKSTVITGQYGEYVDIPYLPYREYQTIVHNLLDTLYQIQIH